MKIKQTIVSLLAVLIAAFLHAQSVTEQQTITSLNSISSKYIDKVADKANQLEEKLTSKSETMLRRLEKEENKLKRKLYKIDSIAANNIFTQSTEKYKAFRQKLSQKAEKITHNGIGNYIPFLDTLKTSLNFLQSDQHAILAVGNEWKDKLKETIGKVDELESRFAQAASIKQFLQQRRQYLKEQLVKFGLGKQLKKMNKEVYYYSQMVREYKEILNDPKKIETHAIAILNKIPAFQKFMQKNSLLASVFGIPGSNNATPVSFTGLQTRASVQQVIQTSTITGSSNNSQQFIQQQLQTANTRISDIKNKLPFNKYSGEPEEVPDFKPNNEKTKSFFKRLEFGSNVQFGKTNRFLPTTSDFAVSLGYKLNNAGTVGIGSAYKLGLGNGIRNIRFTHQGFGLRSYIDWKVKGNFYISGGYEKNYLPALSSISSIVDFNKWQESGLVGITKKQSVSKKKKITIQLLFDFLSYKNIPNSQPVLFRTGWNF